MKIKKVLLSLVLGLSLVAVGVAGTLAYLKSTTETVQNTFTVGKVKITLDEAPVNEKDDNGDFLKKEGARVTANTYAKVVPGSRIDKDPTVHVDANSDDAWLFVKVELEKAITIARAGVELKHLKPADASNPSALVDAFMDWFTVTGFDKTAWEIKKVTPDTANDKVEVIIGYKTKVVASQNVVIFTGVTIPGDLTSELLAQVGGDNGFKMNFTAYAIQAAGLTAEQAYAELFPTTSGN